MTSTKLFKKLGYYTLPELTTIVLSMIWKATAKKQKYNTMVAPYLEITGQLLRWGYKCRRLENRALAIYDPSGKEYRIRVDNSDFQVFKQVIVRGEYFPLFKAYEALGMSATRLNIIDCGSNIGLFSVWINNMFSGSKIVCVEAERANYNFSLNNLKSANMQPLNKALWYNHTETVEISDSFRDGDSWSKAVRAGGEPTKNRVETITLKDIHEDYFKGEIIDILKIDVEGAEAAIFRHPESFGSILQKTRIMAIEIHDEFNCRESINGYLTQHGFTLMEDSETTFAYQKL